APVPWQVAHVSTLPRHLTRGVARPRVTQKLIRRVDGRYGIPTLGEDTRETAAAAGHVEDRGAGRYAEQALERIGLAHRVLGRQRLQPHLHGNTLEEAFPPVPWHVHERSPFMVRWSDTRFAR